MTDVVVLRRESAVTMVRATPTSPIVQNNTTSVVVIKREGIPGPVGSDAGKPVAIVFQLDGGGIPIAANLSVDLPEIPFACVLDRWTLVADQAGSIDLDVYRSSFANFPTFASLPGTFRPALASSQKAQDVLITDWASTQLAIGDVLRVRVVSASVISRATLTLTAIKS